MEGQNSIRWLARAILLGTLLFTLGVHLLGESAVLAILDASPKVCPLRLFFGLKCAFCGMTHAFVYFVFLDFKSATSENLFSVPFLMGSLSLSGFLAFRPDPWSDPTRKRAALLAFFIALTYTVARNL